MRTSSAGVLLLLAACTSPADEAASDPADSIACALAGAASFADQCVMERTRDGETLILTVRHPDGGFRRFVSTGEGPGIEPADGAEPATVSLLGDGIEVAVGADRYRFPATVANDGP